MKPPVFFSLILSMLIGAQGNIRFPPVLIAANDLASVLVNDNGLPVDGDFADYSLTRWS